MYQGTRTTTSRPSFFTGLAALQFKGINLSSKQMEERLGWKPEMEPSYAKVTSQFTGAVQQPATIFLHEPENGVTVRFTINVEGTPYKSSKGNYQVCTKAGSVVWAGNGSSGELVLKPEFAQHRPLVKGEAELITFVQRLIDYSTKFEGDQEWLPQMESNKQDAATVFNGDFSGYEDLYQYATEKDLRIIMPLTVRENDGKFYQGVNENSRTWFSGKVVSSWHIGALEKAEKKEAANGNSLFKNLSTYSFQIFKKEDCFNAIPFQVSQPDNTFNTTEPLPF